MMTISSHKIGGPIGAGALIVASKKHILKPLLFGGDQEDSLRSGTEPILAIAGFGQAAELIEIKQYIDQKGHTIVPITVYLKNGRVKIEFGIAKGKKLWDKRKDKMDKDIKRNIDRKLKGYK